MKLRSRLTFEAGPLSWPAVLSLLGALLVAGCAPLEPQRAPLAANASVGATQPSGFVVPMNVGEDHLALEGYDPVSYFDSPKPVKGSPDITTVDAGVVYRFVSPAHRDLFVAAPERYKPCYGGYCATGAARGYKVPVDPTDYKMEDGKLYLFNKSLLYDAADGWNPEAKVSADRHWNHAVGK